MCMPYLPLSSHAQISRTISLQLLLPWPHLPLNSQPTEIWLLLPQLHENCFLSRSPSTLRLPNTINSWVTSILTSQYFIPLTSWSWNYLLPLFPRFYSLWFSSFPTNCFFSVSFTGPSPLPALKIHVLPQVLFWALAAYSTLCRTGTAMGEPESRQWRI